MSVKISYCVIFLLSGWLGFGQADETQIDFNLTFGNQILQPNQTYISQTDTLQITAFRFYIGNLKIRFEDGTSSSEIGAYHLLDLEKPETLRVALPHSDKWISEVSFSVGVDSTASVSGALSGDLDPANGMYWAWQSGYINMKIEGVSKSCPTRKNEFQFHIGGYLEPNYALRNVTVKTSSKNPKITVDLASFFTHIKLSRTNQVMIPGKAAMQLADYSTKMFRLE